MTASTLFARDRLEVVQQELYKQYQGLAQGLAGTFGALMVQHSPHRPMSLKIPQHYGISFIS